ncbi:hypothetical protein K488DRAFT_73393 [Vararia minispora EC-137]|uniref:Uncharacterized protein n=1 Tax=Vararia minispora EC-137 TaxID=1314806 RepID=A0ACB8QAT3_9AGAM|nr:hypothetical protein K488DRAFT_73393 [Vararia minispora EC-137]
MPAEHLPGLAGAVSFEQSPTDRVSSPLDTPTSSVAVLSERGAADIADRLPGGFFENSLDAPPGAQSGSSVPAVQSIAFAHSFKIEPVAGFRLALSSVCAHTNVMLIAVGLVFFWSNAGTSV